MNQKAFSTLNDLYLFLSSFPDKEKYDFVSRSTSTGDCLVMWKEKKFYTSYTGDFLPDELWVAEYGQIFHVQDLTEDHAKNILRMLIRNQRKQREVESFGQEIHEQSSVIYNNSTLH